jgi:hypothetical protein
MFYVVPVGKRGRDTFLSQRLAAEDPEYGRYVSFKKKICFEHNMYMCVCMYVYTCIYTCIYMHVYALRYTDLELKIRNMAGMFLENIF